MSTPKRKRQQIFVETKKKIIDENEAHPSKSYADLARQFGIQCGKSTVQSIVRDKKKILAAIDDGVGAKRKKLFTGRSRDLEAAVLTWFQQVRSQNVAVSGPLLKVILNRILFLHFILAKSIGVGRRVEHRKLQGK